MAKKNPIIWLLEWIGHAETVRTIAQAEFVRTLLWPTVATMLTGGAGVAGDIPLMWVIMASCVSFMGTTMGVLAGSTYIERKNPLNKLTSQTVFGCDLVPARPALLGSRQQRRAAGRQNIPDLSPTQLDVHVSREIDRAQLGMEIKNNASFPISCLLEFAETEIEGIQPPRSKFPKGPFIIPVGEKYRVNDDRMEMEGYPCQKLAGKINMRVRYGLPGKERFTLELDGTVVIVMEHYGFVSQIYFSPKMSTATTQPTG